MSDQQLRKDSSPICREVKTCRQIAEESVGQQTRKVMSGWQIPQEMFCYQMTKEMIVWQLAKSISEEREMTGSELLSSTRRLVDRRGSGMSFRQIANREDFFGEITEKRLLLSFFSRRRRGNKTDS